MMLLHCTNKNKKLRWMIHHTFPEELLDTTKGPRSLSSTVAHILTRKT